MTTTRRISVELDMGTRSVHFRAGDSQSRKWMDRPEVAQALRATLAPLGLLRIAPDRPLWEKPPPAGIVTPRLIAATLQAGLKSMFPHLEIQVVAPYQAASG